MEYISGIHALNLPCELATCGDWHQSSLKWDDIDIRDSRNSIFAEYGIEKNKKIPKGDKKYNVANHIRAILDILESGEYPFSHIEGMRDDLIVVGDYTDEIFNKVYLLRDNSNWDNINRFMGDEYYGKWLRFLKGKNK